MVKETYKLQDFDHVQTYTADNRGRITLGKDFAERHVHVMAIDITDELDYAYKPPEEEIAVLNKLTKWAMDNEVSIADYDVANGKVLSEDAEWHDTDVEGLGYD